MSTESSTELQRKKIFIVDSSDDESDSEEESKNTSHFKSDESSADVISSSFESTALSGSLSKSDRPLSTRVVEADKKKEMQDSSILQSVFTEDDSSNSKSDGFFSSSLQSKQTSNPEEGVDNGVVKSSEENPRNKNVSKPLHQL